MSRGLTVGGECDAWCTKCKRDTLHNIVAMEASNAVPAQVQCRSCQGMHKYRAPKSAAAELKAKVAERKSTSALSSSRGTSPRPKATSAKAAAEATNQLNIYKRWDDMLGRFGGGNSQGYNIKASYELNDLIEHVQFGLGFVVEEVSFNRIKVLFKDSERVLAMRHGQNPPV